MHSDPTTPTTNSRCSRLIHGPTWPLPHGYRLSAMVRVPEVVCVCHLHYYYYYYASVGVRGWGVVGVGVGWGVVINQRLKLVLQQHNNMISSLVCITHRNSDLSKRKKKLKKKKEKKRRRRRRRRKHRTESYHWQWSWHDVTRRSDCLGQVHSVGVLSAVRSVSGYMVCLREQEYITRHHLVP